VIYLCKPWASGARRINDSECGQVYWYDGSLGSLRAIDLNRVPFTVGYGDAGGSYKFLRENGWLLEFRTILHQSETWAVFYSQNDLVIDTGEDKFYFEHDGVEVDVRVFFFFAKITLRVTKCNLTITRLILFPWHRTWFIDDDREFMECLPITHLFSDLKAPTGYAFWKNSWHQGLRCMSSAIAFQDPVVWSFPFDSRINEGR
jgi:hypothetical protein